MNEIYLTKEGLEELKQRLDELLIVKRPEYQAALQHARSLGDLSENAEYDAARQMAAEVENEITDLEEKIKNAKVIDPKKSKRNGISIGSVVIVEYLGDDADEDEKEMTLRIVSETEADWGKKQISNESPLGKALKGKKVGDKVDVLSSQYLVKEIK